MLNNKRILLGLTGGISIYKSVYLLRLLQSLRATVQVIMTESAQQFMSPLIFEALSQQKVLTSLFDSRQNPIPHIDLAQKADLLVIAPATANILGKIRNGLADDLLTSTVLAFTHKIVLGPAMNENMWHNPIVQENLAHLQSLDQFIIAPPAEGELACQTKGVGRMAEPEELLDYILKGLRQPDLKHRHIVITAGPTQEPLDPVRYISNRASGKMGFALAKEAFYRGANVTLISGPTHLTVPRDIKHIAVQTAQAMFEAVMDHVAQADLIIKNAAVCDFKPAQVYDQKVKKGGGEFRTIGTVPTIDILKALGQMPRRFILVGFAAETEKVVEYARHKLQDKNLDFIVANDVSHGVFGEDQNAACLINKAGEVTEFGPDTKVSLARKIFDALGPSLTPVPSKT